MSKSFLLEAKLRIDKGHAVNKTRNAGLIPATIYGNHLESISISVSVDAFTKVWKEAGETQLVDVSVEGKKHTVLIHNVQNHPYQGRILHVEFFQVNLKEKLKTYVPIEIVGEAPAAVSGLGTLLTLVNEVEVEALPTNIPESIQVDVSSLTDVDMEIKLGELKIPADVTLLTDTDVTVVKIGALVKEEEPVVEAPTEGTATPEDTKQSEEETPATDEKKEE